MEHHKRHQFWWKLLYPLVWLVMKIVLNGQTRRYSPKGPYLVLCNHVMDWDPVILLPAFKDVMYFVTSEHIMRVPLIGPIMGYIHDPITRMKGGSAAGTVKAILRRLKQGHNVCFFPEGNRCWDGVTRPFPESTGKLVRSCGCTLITYRLDGAYLANPRWAGAKPRRGRVTGQLVGIYEPEELRRLSVEEINELIARDIYTDAYASQEARPVNYRGFKRAERLETLLFTCPKCGAMHRLQSKGKRFFCLECGMETVYMPDGSFKGGELPYDNIKSWNDWQETIISGLCAGESSEPIFRDTDMLLRSVTQAKGAEDIATGTMTLYRDRLELPGGITLLRDEISGMSLRGRQNLYIGTSDGRHYELKSEKVRCTVKYLSACTHLGCAVGVGV